MNTALYRIVDVETDERIERELHRVSEPAQALAIAAMLRAAGDSSVRVEIVHADETDAAVQ